jgi:hypothetical protein
VIEIAFKFIQTGLVFAALSALLAGAAALLETWEDGPLTMAAEVVMALAAAMLMGGSTAAALFYIWGL